MKKLKDNVKCDSCAHGDECSVGVEDCTAYADLFPWK